VSSAPMNTALARAGLCSKGVAPVQDLRASPAEHVGRRIPKKPLCCSVPRTYLTFRGHRKCGVCGLLQESKQFYFEHPGTPDLRSEYSLPQLERAPERP